MSDEPALLEKPAILARMDVAHRALAALVARTPGAARERPGAAGDWSIKDLLAHIAFWQGVGLERLQKFGDGRWDEIRWYDPAAIDETNDGVYRANRDQPWDDIVATWQVTYQAFRTAVKSLKPEALAADQSPMTLRDIIAGDGYQHDEEHAADIERALAAHG